LDSRFYRWHVPSGLQPATESQAPPKQRSTPPPPAPDGLLSTHDDISEHPVHFLGLTTEPLALYSSLAEKSDQLFLISLVLGVMLLALGLVCLYGEERVSSPLPTPHSHRSDRFAEFSTIYELENERDCASDYAPVYPDNFKDEQSLRETMSDSASPYMPEKGQSPFMPEINLKENPNTKANLQQIESPASALDYKGTWARTYRKADKGSKEPFQLLFLCGIIPFSEFAHSYVSQEHIDECIWISTQMLRQKPLAEWVSSWEQAMKTFEESVTACFAARTDVIASLYGTSAPNSPKPPDNGGAEPPGSPRSDRGMMDCCTPPGTSMMPPMAPPTQINLPRGGSFLPPPPSSSIPPAVAHMPPLRSTPTTLNTLTEEQIPGTSPNLRASGFQSNPSSTCNSASNSPAQPTTIVLFQDRHMAGSTVRAPRHARAHENQPRHEESTPEPMTREYNSP
jgi:hypothetical protein